jgi:hypothetical protein
MSSSFQCPSCLGDLHFEGGDSAFQICRHCKGKIIVPSAAVHQQELDRPMEKQGRGVNQRDVKIAEIQNAINAGHKIEAIKIFRESFGTDLRTAKDAVDSMIYSERQPSPAQKQSRIYPNSQTNQGVGDKPATGNPTVIGRLISILIQIAIFAAFIYWFFY